MRVGSAFSNETSGGSGSKRSNDPSAEKTPTLRMSKSRTAILPSASTSTSAMVLVRRAVAETLNAVTGVTCGKGGRPPSAPSALDPPRGIPREQAPRAIRKSRRRSGCSLLMSIQATPGPWAIQGFPPRSACIAGGRVRLGVLAGARERAPRRATTDRQRLEAADALASVPRGGRLRWKSVASW